MKRVVAHIDRLVLKGVRVADPALFVVALQAELLHSLQSRAPLQVTRRGAHTSLTAHVRLNGEQGDARTASKVAQGVMEALGS